MVTLVEKIETELQELIQDEGLHPARVGRFAPNIMKATGTDNWNHATDRVKAECWALGEGKYAVALRAALAMTVYAESLTLRRSNLLDSGGFPDVSEATLRRWERIAIKQLAQLLADRTTDSSGFSPWMMGTDLVRQIGPLKQKHDNLISRVRSARDTLARAATYGSPPMDSSSQKILLDTLMTTLADQDTLRREVNVLIDELKAAEVRDLS
ncbi:hypothetical protein NG701_07385 [Pseudarthrobacter sp. HLT3-5]|uniref:hypothetical protein n=1 Tax=Pseudarthrobacter cellobiosi TaxID=2953654 RepID=UPI00208F3256|nr:hypothetical protein [Pseudarthrobacter sp. HLT3-5]MCO4274250.1 hypothetical protein [Pseudarthrobacter sp. HLT3-5]